MPPKAKITKEMIIKAGVEIVRSEGQENLNVRSVAAKLGCSTQPVMYHYENVNALKEDVYAASDAFHTEYLMAPPENADNTLMSLGLRYIQFAVEEKHLFRFLFQSDKFRSKSFSELFDEEVTELMIRPISDFTGLSPEQAKEVFELLFICVHGAASLLANNSMDYDEEFLTRLLDNTMTGAVCALKRGE